MTPQPKVSVLLLAYNLEQYIAQALDSVLMQRVDFPYEIVVGEDCSTDQTPAIIARYTRRHPHRLRPLYAAHNLGMNRNFARTLGACRGQYVALLDADDYWISPDKLQRQVDFLDDNPQCSVCFHNVDVIYEDGRPPHPFHGERQAHFLSRPVPPSVTTLEDLLPGNFLQTCSVLFRRGLFASLPEWFYAMPTYDWPLHVLNAQHGSIAYLNHIWGVYRVHRGGLWSAQMSRYEKVEDVLGMIGAYALLDRHLDYDYKSLLEEPVIPLYARAARLLWARRAYRRGAAYAFKWATAILKPPYHRARRAWLRGALRALRERAARIMVHVRRSDSLPG